MSFPTSPTDGQTWIEGTTEYVYNGTLGTWDINGTTGVDILATYATKANPVFTGSVKIPDAVNADEAVSKGQNDTGLSAKADRTFTIGGDGYQWVDETSNRARGTTYTNTSGKPIMLNVEIASNSTSGSVYVYVDGIKAGSSYQGSGNRVELTTIVMNGSTYSVDSGDGAMQLWLELK